MQKPADLIDLIDLIVRGRRGSNFIGESRSC